jgi:hypothetical protein
LIGAGLLAWSLTSSNLIGAVTHGSPVAAPSGVAPAGQNRTQVEQWNFMPISAEMAEAVKQFKTLEV